MADPNKEPLRNIPTVHVPHVRADIGPKLKAARQAKGWSLDAVAQQTRIPKKYLDAMEADRLDDLPALVYLRGFLKGYCDHLEIPFEPLWDAINPNAPAPAAPAPQAPAGKAGTAAPKTASPSTPPPAARPAAPPPSRHHHEEEKSSPAGAAVLVVSIVVALGAFIWLRQHKSELPPQTSTPAALEPSVEPARPELTIVAEDETWLSVKADGALVFEGRMPKGARQAWQARRGFLLRAPQPGRLSVLLNGATVQLSSATAEGDYKLE